MINEILGALLNYDEEMLWKRSKGYTRAIGYRMCWKPDHLQSINIKLARSSIIDKKNLLEKGASLSEVIRLDICPMVFDLPGSVTKKLYNIDTWVGGGGCSFRVEASQHTE
jgi:hypothetical protein